MAATSPSAAVSSGRCVHHRDHRMQPEPADGNVERGEQPEHTRLGGRQPDFFVRLPQRRLLEGFARFHDAARQRHLSAVASERAGSNA